MSSHRRDRQPADEIDELFGRANPNPDRVGCPPRDVLIALSRRELPIGDVGYEHLTTCSPCYLEVRALQEADKERRRQRMFGLVWRTAAAAAVVLVAVTAAWFFFVGRRATELRVELDLRPYALTRSESQTADRPPLVLPRARVALTLLLPVGSEAGAYEVQILDTGLKPRASAAGDAEVRNFVTTLRTALDLQSLSPGRYQLAIRRDGEERQLFPRRLD